MRIDLHGCTLQEAYSKVAQIIEECYYNEEKSIQFITGRSGEMRREFPMWVENNSKVRECYEVARGGGLFSVRLRKKK